MRLIIVDWNKRVTDAAERVFNGDNSVTVINDDFRHIEADAFVTAGNSYGFMDGGIDLHVRDHFPGVEAAIQECIVDHYGGELVVGNSITVPTEDQKIPLLVYTPTMRTPSLIPEGSDTIYRAMHSALFAVQDEDIQTLAVCGLGALTGNVPPMTFATQVKMAWNNFGKKRTFRDGYQIDKDIRESWRIG